MLVRREFHGKRMLGLSTLKEATEGRSPNLTKITDVHALKGIIEEVKGHSGEVYFKSD